MEENSSVKLSYTLFCRLKPFWVKNATQKDAETCLWKHHENFQLQATKLKEIKLTETDNLEELVKQITCNSKLKTCMYGKCEDCKMKYVNFAAYDVKSELT